MNWRTSNRGKHELAHSRRLARSNPGLAWGWGTPAGRVRARRRFELIAKGAQLRAGMRILEIGCGTGLFTEMFAKTGTQIIAVDISADLLERARMRELPRGRVQFLEKRFEECDMDGPFDAVVGSSVLHHLDIDLALNKIYDLLVPGGFASFAEPNMMNPQVFIERKLSFLRRWFWYVSPDETAFVRRKLHTLLLKTGFENIQITPFDWLHPATPSSLIRRVQNTGCFLEKMPVLREFSGSLHIRCRRQFV